MEIIFAIWKTIIFIAGIYGISFIVARGAAQGWKGISSNNTYNLYVKNEKDE